MGPHLSTITLNVNGLNGQTKRQRLAEWIQKQDPYIFCLQETHLKTRHIQTKSEGLGKNISPRDQKKAGVTILISDKINFQIKAVKRDKEGHYIKIKGSRYNKKKISRRRYNNYKYICTQHRKTTTYLANANEYERGN